MVVDKFQSVQKITKPILKKFVVWRVLQGGHVDDVTWWTAPPIEVPPELKKNQNLRTKQTHQPT